jgi:MraZ protein
MLLFGEYDVTLDAKRRMTIPLPVRRCLGEEGAVFHATGGTDGRLCMYPRPEGDPSLQPITGGPNLWELGCFLYTFATPLRPDSTGRVRLPQRLVRRHSLGRDLTIIGVRDHLEVWNRIEWRTRAAEFEREMPRISAAASQMWSRPSGRAADGRQSG